MAWRCPTRWLSRKYPLPFSGDLCVAHEHLLKSGHVEFTLTHNDASVHDSVSGAHRTTTEPGLDEVSVGASKGDAVNRPHD